MTPEELRDWRIKVCTDLANGVQYQIRHKEHGDPEWVDVHACSIAAGVFNDSRNPDTIRPKPTHRKVWIGWYAAGSVMVDNEEAKARFKWPSPVKWQLVEEEVK